MTVNDKIKSNLTTSYMLFVFDFGDPSNVNKESLEKQIECPIVDVFSSQKKTDNAKKVLGKENFNKLLAAYFSQFQTQDGFNYKTLGEELVKNRKVFIRHLGKDKCSILALLVKVMEALGEPKRGLLSA